MSDIQIRGPLPQSNINPASQRSSALALAQRNAGMLVALLYLQDIFWLIVSRIQLSFYEPMYLISSFEWSIFAFFILLTTFFAGFGIVAARLVRPLRKISAPRRTIPAVIFLATCLNLIQFGVLVTSARYVSGGLTGSAGVIYGTAQAMSLASMVLLIRAKKSGRRLSKVWLLAFLGSLAITIDGMAAALLIGMFVLIILDIRIHRPERAIALMAVATGLLWLGFQAKFSQVPDYLTPEFMARWTIARFSIQAEQMYTFLAGQSLIGDSISYLDLVFRAISDRLDLVMGRPLMLEYPRSVSEAIYYDMRGAFDAGSSPGALLGTTLQGVFFFVPPFVFAFLFLQYFYGIHEKATLPQLFAYSFIFKTLHANFSEFLTIISPTLLVVVIFLLACLLAPRQDGKNGIRNLEIDE